MDRIRAFGAGYPWIHGYMRISPATSLIVCIERRPHARPQLDTSGRHLMSVLVWIGLGAIAFILARTMVHHPLDQ